MSLLFDRRVYKTTTIARVKASSWKARSAKEKLPAKVERVPKRYSPSVVRLAMQLRDRGYLEQVE
jgi:hypothetical protein